VLITQRRDNVLVIRRRDNALVVSQDLAVRIKDNDPAVRTRDNALAILLHKRLSSAMVDNHTRHQHAAAPHKVSAQAYQHKGDGLYKDIVLLELVHSNSRGIHNVPEHLMAMGRSREDIKGHNNDRHQDRAREVDNVLVGKDVVADARVDVPAHQRNEHKNGAHQSSKRSQRVLSLFHHRLW
jgi:hypothetical protein